MSKILFVGAGAMAGAIAGGMVKNSFASGDMAALEVSAEAAKKFTERTGVGTISSLADKSCMTAEIVILAIKPQVAEEALGAFKDLLKDKLIISIMAGISLESLRKLTGSAKIVRGMPNTPALIGKGVGVYALAGKLSSNELDTVKKIFDSIGEFSLCDEKYIDAVTALSGSGPAYVFDFIQALADGGVNAGLPRELALKLAVGTVAGAAELVKESGRHPIELRDQVISPGGTTARAMAVLDNCAFRGAVIDAVMAAKLRSEELGRK